MRRNTKGKRVNERPMPYKPYEKQDFSKLHDELKRKGGKGGKNNKNRKRNNKRP